MPNENQQILKDLIKLSGLSQKQFAAKHEIEYKKFNHWVTGYRNISLPTLQLFAFDYGKSIIFEYKFVDL